MNNKIKIVLVIIIFAGGWILGSNNNTAPVITSSMGGASYSGGYQPEAQAAVQAEGAVALRTEQGQIHLVKDGDSIQAAGAACKQRRDVERYKQDYIYPGAMRAGDKKELARRFTSLVDIRGPLHR